MEQTALHVVASSGNFPWVEVLLEKGANPKLKDSDGCTPLEVAVSHLFFEGYAFLGYTKVIALLVKAGDSGDSLNDLYNRYTKSKKSNALEELKKLEKIIKFINLIE